MEEEKESKRVQEKDLAERYSWEEILEMILEAYKDENYKNENAARIIFESCTFFSYWGTLILSLDDHSTMRERCKKICL